MHWETGLEKVSALCKGGWGTFVVLGVQDACGSCHPGKCIYIQNCSCPKNSDSLKPGHAPLGSVDTCSGERTLRWNTEDIGLPCALMVGTALLTERSVPWSHTGSPDLRVTRDNWTMKRNGPHDSSPSGRSVIRTVQTLTSESAGSTQLRAL